MVLGAWIFVAPWALGFTALGRASWDHRSVGALVFLIALWRFSVVRDRPMATTGAPPVNPPPRNPPVR